MNDLLKIKLTKKETSDLKKLNNLLKKLSKNDLSKINKYYNEPKLEFFNLNTIDFIKINPSKNIKIVYDNLKSQIYGEAMGS